MTVLIDMNLSPLWVEWLQLAGHEAIHWISVGPAPMPDHEIMAFAKARRWIVLTNDLDFGNMLAWSRDSQPTVIQIRADDLRIEAIGPAVLAALKQVSDDSDAGALITVDPKRTRVRLLPFPERT